VRKERQQIAATNREPRETANLRRLTVAEEQPAPLVHLTTTIDHTIRLGYHGEVTER